MKKTALAIMALTLVCSAAVAQNVKKIGIIGLDTSHAATFMKTLNAKDSDVDFVQKYEVTAAYPYGSKEIESSYKRIPQYIEVAKENGVEIVGSIAELLEKVDYVFLETNDGHPHLEQAAEVFKAGKKCFIDKPAAATLGETIALYTVAEKYGQKTFSSSSLRFSKPNMAFRSGVSGKVLGADCYSPHHGTPTHPDFGFYGLHGIESLYTIMGTGCKYVTRVHSDEYGDIVSGVWDDGRLGTFRALSSKPSAYGGTVMTEKGAVPAGGYEGETELLKAIFNFFENDVLPVEPAETIEIFTFMKASNMSLERGGKAVTLEEAMKAGQKDAKKLLKKYL